MTLDDLKPAPYNPRIIAPEEFARLGISMDVHGDLSGITWNANTGNQVTGHQRVRELKERYGDALKLCFDGPDPNYQEHGWYILTPKGTRYPIRIVNWTEGQEKAANLAANSLDAQGRFDFDAVAALLDEISAEDFDLSLTALSPDTLETIQQLHAAQPPATGFPEPVAPAPAPRAALIPSGDGGTPPATGGGDDDTPPATGGGDDDTPPENAGQGGTGTEVTERPLRQAVVAYNLVFEDGDQQQRWYDFLRYLKAEYPGDTIGGRLTNFIDELLAEDETPEGVE